MARSFLSLITMGICLSVGVDQTRADDGAARRANSRFGPGLRRILYVTQNQAGTIKLYDIDRGHTYLREIDVPIQTVYGVCADVASGTFFYTDRQSVYAFDLIDEKILWEVNIHKEFGYHHPDRLTITRDGRALYVPCKRADKMMILEAATGRRLREFARPGNPHNTFTGERGRYIYCAGRSHDTMYVADPKTHRVVKKIGPFSSPIRPFSVNESETYFFANLTETLGFGVGDIAAGTVLCEITRKTPHERLARREAFAGYPHGNNPYSHGIAVRPGSEEVWLLDDAWGYLYVYDITVMPPVHRADVPLFSSPTDKGLPEHNRWVSFSIDGKYCYVPTLVIDADARRVVARIADSEKQIEIDFKDGVPIRAAGQNGGVYPARPIGQPAG